VYKSRSKTIKLSLRGISFKMAKKRFTEEKSTTYFDWIQNNTKTLSNESGLSVVTLMLNVDAIDFLALFANPIISQIINPLVLKTSKYHSSVVQFLTLCIR
jgi:hypothetical protein